MASPKKNSNGVWHVTASLNYERRKLTIGMVSKPAADQFTVNLNRLIDHRRQFSGIPLALQSWVQALSDRQRQQLGEIGVLSKYDTTTTVGQLIKAFLEHYEQRPESEVKPITKSAMRQVLTHRVPMFLKSKLVSKLEPYRPDDMPKAKPMLSEETERLYVKVVSWQREHYSLSSWSRANGRLNEVGNWAVRRGICKHNPFAELPKPDQVNDERNEYIDREWILDVMDNCDPDTRLSLAMGRFSGLRSPSECRRMKPGHVEFETGELRIIGKGNLRPIRRMPLFDLVRDELIRHRDTVGWSRTVFSTRFMSATDSNHYRLIRKAVDRAGYDRWPRLRQNLRTSCVNDLLEAGFSEREVTLWIGHTVKTSRKSYQKQTAAHLQAAVIKARELGY